MYCRLPGQRMILQSIWNQPCCSSRGLKIDEPSRESRRQRGARISNRDKQGHYDVLELSRNASPAEIKDAYMKLVKKYHPDRNPGQKGAYEKFLRVKAAYEVLKDEDTRVKYNRQGFRPGSNRYEKVDLHDVPDPSLWEIFKNDSRVLTFGVILSLAALAAVHYKRKFEVEKGVHWRKKELQDDVPKNRPIGSFGLTKEILESIVEADRVAGDQDLQTQRNEYSLSK